MTAMEIDATVAAALGFPKLKYAWVERERRWLCCEIPMERVTDAAAITDLYVTRARLRLREARPLDGGPVMRRLTRKADVDAATRLITSIYLAEPEFALLAGLPGRPLRKTRHHLKPVNGVVLSVDRFEGALEGLILAEAEFETAEALAAFPTPDFAIREVTEDPRYRGGTLATEGLPRD
jgi:CYTH domain-containing protein